MTYRIVPAKAGLWSVEEQVAWKSRYTTGMWWWKSEHEYTHTYWHRHCRNSDYITFETKDEAKAYIDVLLRDAAHLQTPPEEYP